ncbi:hypothetical protein ACWDNI_15800 [Nocardia niigatensis]
MGDITTTIPAGTDSVEQARLVREADRDLGLDTTALQPLAERVRAAFDSAALFTAADTGRGPEAARVVPYTRAHMTPLLPSHRPRRVRQRRPRWRHHTP